jgi:hypothetical protein
MLLHNFVNFVFYLVVVASIFYYMKFIQQMLISSFFIVLINAAADGHTGQTIAHTYPKRRQTGVAYK